MKALHRMDRYRKEVLQLSTRKHGINVQYLYDKNCIVVKIIIWCESNWAISCFSPIAVVCIITLPLAFLSLFQWCELELPRIQTPPSSTPGLLGTPVSAPLCCGDRDTI